MPPRGILCLTEEMNPFVMLEVSCIDTGAFEKFPSSFPSQISLIKKSTQQQCLTKKDFSIGIFQNKYFKPFLPKIKKYFFSQDWTL